MSYRVFQPNFSRGERAPHLRSRFDADLWQSSVEKARNVFVLKYGGLSKRPGTLLVGEVLDASQPTRLMPFQFSNEQTYALEVGQGYMAPVALGGRILEDELFISDIAPGATTTLTIAFHGYAVGQNIWIESVLGEMGEVLNFRAWRIVAVPDDNTIEIEADTQGLTFEGADEGEVRVVAPAPEPTPPVVPTPVQPPEDPVVGGGGGGGFRKDSGNEQTSI